MVALADRPDYRAISALTGVPVTSVGVTRGRCLAKLRRLLDDDERWAER
jgi:DNA-directed RNA polymerase specialized sigma24 family protein